MDKIVALSPRCIGNVLDSAPDAMIIIDASGLIRFVNRQVLLCSVTRMTRSLATASRS